MKSIFSCCDCTGRFVFSGGETLCHRSSRHGPLCSVAFLCWKAHFYSRSLFSPAFSKCVLACVHPRLCVSTLACRCEMQLSVLPQLLSFSLNLGVKFACPHLQKEGYSHPEVFPFECVWCVCFRAERKQASTKTGKIDKPRQTTLTSLWKLLPCKREALQ